MAAVLCAFNLFIGAKYNPNINKKEATLLATSLSKFNEKKYNSNLLNGFD